MMQVLLNILWLFYLFVRKISTPIKLAIHRNFEPKPFTPSVLAKLNRFVSPDVSIKPSKKVQPNYTLQYSEKQ